MLPARYLSSLKYSCERLIMTLIRCPPQMICVGLGVDESASIDLSMFISDLDLISSKLKR